MVERGEQPDYHVGGWLPSALIVVTNTSGQPEWVLTLQQFTEQERDSDG